MQKTHLTPNEAIQALKAVAIDFDGVIHKYSKGYHDGTCYDKPHVGSKEALELIMSKHPVFIFTARNVHQVKDYMSTHFRFVTELIPVDVKFWTKKGVLGITNKKLPASAYVDDLAIRFTNWEEVLKELC